MASRRGPCEIEVRVEATAYVSLGTIDTSDLIAEVNSRGSSIYTDEELAGMLRSRGWSVIPPEYPPSSAADFADLAAYRDWLASKRSEMRP